MLVLASFLVIVAVFIVTKIYADSDRRLPPTSAPKGKESRIVLGIVLFFGIIVVALNTITQIKTYGITATWVFVTAVVIGLPTMRYINFKKEQKKKKY
jgi:uncharacterized membrane protein (DUF4010 family)